MLRAILLALFLGTAVLAGCGIVPRQEIPVSQTLSPAEQEIQRTINRANSTLAAAYEVISQNTRDGVMTKAEGRDYIAKLDVASAKVDQAQKLLDAKLVDLAKVDASVVNDLITRLHAEVAARARKASQ